MKKFALYSLLALSLGFAACDEVEDPTGTPAVNEPEAAFDFDAFKLSTPIVDNGAVDLPALNAAGKKNVVVVNIDDASNLPEGYELQLEYEFSGNQDFSDVRSIPIEIIEMDGAPVGVVTTDALESLYEDFFGLSEAAQPVYTRVAAYAYDSATKVTVRIGGAAKFYSSVNYTLTPDPVFVLYTPGNSNGWNQEASQQLSSTNGKDFQGYAYLDGEFKFTALPNWDGPNYGAGANAGELSTDGGAGNLSVADAGLYWCKVNTAALTYSTAYITTYGVIGAFNGWSSSVALTPNENFLVWTGTVTMTEGDEFKFRANDDWAISLGNSLDELIDNSQTNLKAPATGTFEITLDLSSYPCKAAMVKQ